MLSFLSIAAAKKYVVATYDDDAEGFMGKNEQGKMALLEIVLKPKLLFEGSKIPSQEQLERMHHQAHEECFIANSIKTNIKIITK